VDIPRTREELIDTHLSDDDIVIIIHSLKERIAKYGDVQAARLLFEFKYGKNPEPPSGDKSLAELMLESPLAKTGLGSE
jgi:hypothetical protein